MCTRELVRTLLLSLVTLSSVFVYIILNATNAPKQAPIVHLSHGGQLIGKVVDADQPEQVFMYEGFPYGKARRFQKPQIHPGWSGKWNATFPRESCPFLGLNKTTSYYTTRAYSEDCLYMTVWTPSLPSSILRPVMVYIYGGSFTSGSVFKITNDYRYMSARGDVIVVGFNYRLGAFGFLYSGDENAPGNVGLWDQVLALQWIKENIHQFGGDSNRVTVFGHSSGAEGIVFMLGSPAVTEKLFHRAILQSGGANILHLNKTEALSNTRKLAQNLNCSTQSLKQMIRCLQERPIDDLLYSVKDSQLSFIPVIGDAFLPFSSVGKFSEIHRDIDLMFGFTSNESASFFLDILPQLYPEQVNFTLEDAMDAVPEILKLYNLDSPEMVRSTTQFYLGALTNQTSPNELRKVLTELRSDIDVNCPLLLFVEQWAQFALVSRFYGYHFEQRAKRFDGFCDSEWMGVCHGSELFHLAVIPQQLYEADRKVSEAIIRSWTNFAWTGSPGHASDVFWDQAFKRNSSLSLIQNFINPQLMRLEHLKYSMISSKSSSNCEQFWIDKIKF